MPHRITKIQRTRSFRSVAVAGLCGAALTVAVGVAAPRPVVPVVVKSITPSSLSLGGIGTIDGDGFTKLPTFRVIGDLSDKKYNLKVLSFTTNQAQVQFVKGEPGDFDLYGQVGKSNSLAPMAFHALTGQLGSLSASSAFLNDSLTITGVDFGTITGSVWVGTKKAKVTHWDDTSITFTFPKLTIGNYNLRAANKLSDFSGSLSVFANAAPPPPGGADNVTGLFGSTPFSAKGNPAVIANYNFQSHSGTITANCPSTAQLPARLLTFNTLYNLNTDVAPKTIQDVGGTNIQYSQTPLGGLTTTWTYGGLNTHYDLRINYEKGSEQTGSTMTGTLSGTLQRTAGTEDPEFLPFTVGFKAFY